MTVTMPWKASGDTPVNGVASKIEDVRKSLSKEAERLAEMAAQYSRDASEHAQSIADDASKQAAKVARDSGAKAQEIASDPQGHASSLAGDVMKAAAGLGTALALSSRKTAQDLSDNAQSLATDLRKVRLTTEPRKTGPDFLPGITLLAGFGAGIALMWFLDPERGKARRNLLRDKLMSWTRQAKTTAAGTAKDLSNRAQGAMYETRKQLSSQTGEADDSDTQLWSSASNDKSYGDGSSNGSTTDTWGTQPQPSLQESGSSY